MSDEIKYLKKQIARYKALKMEYYEKYVSSQITKEEFLQKKADLFEQTEVFEQNLRDKEAEWNALDEDGSMQEMAMLRARKITQYQNVEELSPELMREVVRKIVVMPGNRIEIVWNFEDEISKIVGKETKLDMKVAI